MYLLLNTAFRYFILYYLLSVPSITHNIYFKVIITLTTTSAGVVNATITMEATLSGFIDKTESASSPTLSEITVPGLMLYRKQSKNINISCNYVILLSSND